MSIDNVAKDNYAHMKYLNTYKKVPNIIEESLLSEVLNVIKSIKYGHVEIVI